MRPRWKDLTWFTPRARLLRGMRVSAENYEQVARWAGIKEFWGPQAPELALHVETDHGLRMARVGDWVLKDRDGNLWVCDALSADQLLARV